MNHSSIKKISLTALLATLACGTLLAQEVRIAPAKPSSVVVPYRDTSSPDANVTIFSNLGPTSTNLYDIASGGYFVTGPTNTDPNMPPEQWIALPFTPKVASHAKTLQAAVGYLSGTKKMRLGLYNDSLGTVGTLLADKVTTVIPDFGVCCAVVQVSLGTPGVALTAGTQYWLVASPDATAPDFAGAWQFSNTAKTAFQQPTAPVPIPWTTFSDGWPAGAVKGTAP